ncbi:hypothetical protein [Aliidiomarina soli]|uniref:Uncharacterized protein n=1 Tax=Aliidiomarina soli TaxID=1928574 RepID=A0A432WFP7_9GAMM|nr:hypothetical protein [Aliidiomarina soli]RUO32610.1 hypothetical protein CWE14_10755 [Aliidiomarina soli]
MRSLIAGLLSVLCVTVAVAQEAGDDHRAALQCDGHWTAQIQGKAAEFSALHGGSAWIPVELQLDQTLIDCADQLHIGPGTGTSWYIRHGMSRLRVEPYDQRRNALMLGSEGNGWVLPLHEERPQLMFWLRVLDADYATPGVYRGVLVSQFMNTQTPWLMSAQKNDVFEFVIEPRVSVQIDAPGGGTGSYYRVDFGSLRSGAFKDFNLVVDSNSDIQVFVTSENQGVMRHIREPSQTIPYRFRLNHRFVDLKNPSTTSIQRLRQRGTWRVPIRIDVPYVGKEQLAGEYSDLITIDVFPQD